MILDTTNCPIAEYYDDSAKSLDMYFSNGKKHFYKFKKIQDKKIDKCILFCPRDFKKLLKIFCKCELIYNFKAASTLSPVYLYDNKVLIALCPLGGASSCNLMEELIYVGIKQFISVGTCGAIVTDVQKDAFFVPSKAIRDEGTSYHYLPPSRYVDLSKKLQTKILDTLESKNLPVDVGCVWTTDAMYRETPKRISARVADGAKAVDMEIASLATCAKSHGVEFASLLYYSDYNNGQTWQTRIYDKFKLREELTMLAINSILAK